MAVVVSIVLLAGFVTGTLLFPVNAEYEGNSESKEVVLSHEYKTGDSWNYTTYDDDEVFGEVTMNPTVEDDDATYDGHDVYKMSIDLSVENFENEEGEFKNFSGSGTAYENDIRYLEREMNGEFSPADTDDWYDITIENEIKTTRNISIPDRAEIGDNFSIEMTTETTTIRYIDGEKMEENESTKTQHREIEIQGKETVSVEAGQFETIVLSWTSEEEEGEIYYSPEVKREVRKVTREDGNITSEMELQDYEVEGYDLTINTNGEGTVDIAPEKEGYEPGTEVDLTAEADNGWEFDEWTVDETGTETTITIMMNEDKTITANFIEVEEDDGGESVPGFTTILLLLAMVIAMATYKKKR
ncbi:MAG: hypothetical protein V5A76_04865 [Candidatus Thermoplasmatota archaeon]